MSMKESMDALRVVSEYMRLMSLGLVDEAFTHLEIASSEYASIDLLVAFTALTEQAFKADPRSQTATRFYAGLKEGTSQIFFADQLKGIETTEGGAAGGAPVSE